jgi:hypothetical protein
LDWSNFRPRSARHDGRSLFDRAPSRSIRFTPRERRLSQDQHSHQRENQRGLDSEEAGAGLRAEQTRHLERDEFVFSVSAGPLSLSMAKAWQGSVLDVTIGSQR